MNRLSFLGDIIFGKKEGKQKPITEEATPSQKPIRQQPKFKQKLVERRRVTFQGGGRGFAESWEVKKSDFATGAATVEADMHEYLDFILSQRPRKIVIEAGENIKYDKTISEEEDE